MSAEPTIEDVRNFWDANPLWTGESEHPPGTFEFFEEHNRIVVGEILAGQFAHFMPRIDLGGRILDVGCGVGFWTVAFARAGFADVTGIDLSARSLALARARADAYGVSVELLEGNAEALEFADASFDHVNCQGVIHHTPSPEAAVAEIARVLRPGGTAVISVYYRNLAVGCWPALSWIGRGLTRLGAGLGGRGRESIFAIPDHNELVRSYDGADNPLGVDYSRRAFTGLLAPRFEIDHFTRFFFPSRAFGLRLPPAAQALLNRACPFMIAAHVRKH